MVFSNVWVSFKPCVTLINFRMIFFLQNNKPADMGTHISLAGSGAALQQTSNAVNERCTFVTEVIPEKLTQQENSKRPSEVEEDFMAQEQICSPCLSKDVVTPSVNKYIQHDGVKAKEEQVVSPVSKDTDKEERHLCSIKSAAVIVSRETHTGTVKRDETENTIPVCKACIQTRTEASISSNTNLPHGIKETANASDVGKRHLLLECDQEKPETSNAKTAFFETSILGLPKLLKAPGAEMPVTSKSINSKSSKDPDKQEAVPGSSNIAAKPCKITVEPVSESFQDSENQSTENLLGSEVNNIVIMSPKKNTHETECMPKKASSQSKIESREKDPILVSTSESEPCECDISSPCKKRGKKRVHMKKMYRSARAVTKHDSDTDVSGNANQEGSGITVNYNSEFPSGQEEEIEKNKVLSPRRRQKERKISSRGSEHEKDAVFQEDRDVTNEYEGGSHIVTRSKSKTIASPYSSSQNQKIVTGLQTPTRVSTRIQTRSSVKDADVGDKDDPSKTSLSPRRLHRSSFQNSRNKLGTDNSQEIQCKDEYSSIGNEQPELIPASGTATVQLKDMTPLIEKTLQSDRSDNLEKTNCSIADISKYENQAKKTKGQSKLDEVKMRFHEEMKEDFTEVELRSETFSAERCLKRNKTNRYQSCGFDVSLLTPEEVNTLDTIQEAKTNQQSASDNFKNSPATKTSLENVGEEHDVSAQFVNIAVELPITRPQGYQCFCDNKSDSYSCNQEDTKITLALPAAQSQTATKTIQSELESDTEVSNVASFTSARVTRATTREVQSGKNIVVGKERIYTTPKKRIKTLPFSSDIKITSAGVSGVCDTAGNDTAETANLLPSEVDKFKLSNFNSEDVEHGSSPQKSIPERACEMQTLVQTADTVVQNTTNNNCIEKDVHEFSRITRSKSKSITCKFATETFSTKNSRKKAKRKSSETKVEDEFPKQILHKEEAEEQYQDREESGHNPENKSLHMVEDHTGNKRLQTIMSKLDIPVDSNITHIPGGSGFNQQTGNQAELMDVPFTKTTISVIAPSETRSTHSLTPSTTSSLSIIPSPISILSATRTDLSQEAVSPIRLSPMESALSPLSISPILGLSMPVSPLPPTPVNKRQLSRESTNSSLGVLTPPVIAISPLAETPLQHLISPLQATSAETQNAGIQKSPCVFSCQAPKSAVSVKPQQPATRQSLNDSYRQGMQSPTGASMLSPPVTDEERSPSAFRKPNVFFCDSSPQKVALQILKGQIVCDDQSGTENAGVRDEQGDKSDDKEAENHDGLLALTPQKSSKNVQKTVTCYKSLEHSETENEVQIIGRQLCDYSDIAFTSRNRRQAHVPKQALTRGQSSTEKKVLTVYQQQFEARTQVTKPLSIDVSSHIQSTPVKRSSTHNAAEIVKVCSKVRTACGQQLTTDKKQKESSAREQNISVNDAAVRLITEEHGKHVQSKPSSSDRQETESSSEYTKQILPPVNKQEQADLSEVSSQLISEQRTDAAEPASVQGPSQDCAQEMSCRRRKRKSVNSFDENASDEYKKPWRDLDNAAAEENPWTGKERNKCILLYLSGFQTYTV